MPKIRADNIDEHKAQTRAALLEAAYVLMAREGYDAMRREDVAALAGVARTLLEARAQTMTPHEWSPDAVIQLALADVQRRTQELSPVASSDFRFFASEVTTWPL